MKRAYRQQVALLLTVLPEVAKEKCLALHGGTAINLFVRDMPRLSVDIDLTYVPIEDRNTSLQHIAEALGRIKANVERAIPGVRITTRLDAGKLQISANKADIKLEVNLLENEGFTQEIKEGFLLFLLCSDRPIHEIIAPHFQDQRSALSNQFSGMTDEEFSYAAYESVRENLVATIHQYLTDRDKAFLLSVKNLTPDWSIYDFERFPSISWKLRHLQKLKDQNPGKHREQYETLKKKLGM